MQRPKRQAAENAMAKIRDIRQWETLPETSQRFKECAALIDAELEAEIKKKKVKTCDLDMSESEEEESQDKFYDAHDGFVIADDQICDADPDFKIKEHDLLQEESDDTCQTVTVSSVCRILSCARTPVLLLPLCIPATSMLQHVAAH